LPKIFYGRYQGTRYAKHYSAEAKVQKILRTQTPEAVSEFQLGKMHSSELLPGGLPVLDHTIAFLSTQPAWEKATDVLKSFSKLRTSHPDSLPEIRELVLGEAKPSDYEEVGNWLIEKHQETSYKYGLCVPALDVEEIGVVLNPETRDWDRIRTKLLLNEEVIGQVKGPGLDKAPRFNVPILLMYGSVGWQLHLRLPVKYQEKDDSIQVTFTETFVEQSTLTELFKLFRPAVGTGVQKDIEAFIQAVNSINTLDLPPNTIPAGIPLDTLAKLSGISHSQNSLVSLVYLVLGGVLPKDWRCSVADHMWGKPLRDLGSGLKAYLAGDIQQVSVTASTLLITWVCHIIPDAWCILEVTNADPLEFIATWVDMVIKHELHLFTTQTLKSPLAKTREQLLSKIGITPNSNSLVSLCPNWPSVTSGGPKDLTETKEFSLNAISLLQKIILSQIAGTLPVDLPASPEPASHLPSPISPMEVTPTASPEPVSHPSSPATVTPPPALPIAEPQLPRQPPSMPDSGAGPPKSYVCYFCPFRCWSVPELKKHVAACDGDAMEVDHTPAPPSAPNITPLPPIVPTPSDSTAAHQASAPPTDENNQIELGDVFSHPATKTSKDPYFGKRPEDLTTAELNKLSKDLKVTQKQVVGEYIIRDLERAVRLLSLLEEDLKYGITAFHYFQGCDIVKALRVYLHKHGRLPTRSPQWEDIWKIRQATEEERVQYQTYLIQQQQKAQRRLDQVNDHLKKSASVLTAPRELTISCVRLQAGKVKGSQEATNESSSESPSPGRQR
jgi:hypothetical protein